MSQVVKKFYRPAAADRHAAGSVSLSDSRSL